MTINVMVNGLPGKMATAVVNEVAKTPDFRLIYHSLTGPEISEDCFMVKNVPLINYIRPNNREQFLNDTICPPDISVDATHPSAVNNNADFYCRNNLHFIMLTTGGDRKALEQRVKDSDICAVIAPNMAKQVVAFQAMMKYAAETFPDAFKGYSLEIVESHQKGKADTSGTAKAMVEFFNKLGIPFSVDQIKMIREPAVQLLRVGVPEEALTGHGWHTYTLKSNDRNVMFEFTHNVNGRSIYAEGTIDAIRYLDKKIKEGNKGKVYSMIDILKGN